MARDYKPSLPFGEANPYASEAPDADRGGLSWSVAPGTSHVWGWRYYDARKWSFLRKFGDGRSQLHVRFKSKTGGVAATYWYFFTSPEAGQAVADKMAGSPHPYGEVLYPLVIRGGVPYTRQG